MENIKKQDRFFLQGKKQNVHKFNNKVKPQEAQGNNQDFKGKNRNFQGNEKRNAKFDENRSAEDNNDEKKPFDKKTYRLKKYSKKYKLDQWEEQRKKRLLRNLQKDLKAEEGTGTYKPKTFDEDATDGQDVVGRFVKHPDLIEKEMAEKEKAEKEKKKPILTAREKHEKMKQEKLEKQQQVQKVIEEKRQKMQEYRKKKQEKFKKLSKKTKKGQPVMTGRLELLLEKIQKNK